MSKIASWFRRNPSEEAILEETSEPRRPRFVCRTCATAGPFYVAREVTNWNTIGEPHRTPSGDLTYRVYNSYLPGEPGPALAYLCGNCRARTETLEELVLEPLLVESDA